MGTDVTEAVKKFASPYGIKAHSVMCTELFKLVNRVEKIVPEIEATRPRCSSGFESPCLLIEGIGKAKLLIQDCCESSKLYLALNGKTVLSRCKRSKDLMEQSLSQIQKMVPLMLASKISQIIEELKGVKFSLNQSEEEAGKAIRSILEGYHLGKESENECIQIAAQKLQITSPKALFIEQESIKKLLQKLNGDNKQKRQILEFLLNLLEKYGNSIVSGHIENENYEQNQDNNSQTVDFRVDRGKDMSVTPTEDQIQYYNGFNSWEDSSSSVNSLTSLIGLQLPADFSSLSLSSLENSRVDEDAFEFVDDLSKDIIDDARPWEFQCKFVEDLITRLKTVDQACKFISCENLVGSLVKFLTVARDTNDVKAQMIGCRLLLILVTKCRSIKCLSKDAYKLIAEFLDSEVTEEALAITEELSSRQNCQSEVASSSSLNNIFKILETQIRENQILALKILYNLTSTRYIASLIVFSDLIPKLVTLSEDDSLSRYCIAILANLCGDQDNNNIIAETKGCISFVAKALDSESYEEQEPALEVLFSLCSQSIHHCRIVMDEDVISSLVMISSNGNVKAKARAHDILQLLGDTKL